MADSESNHNGGLLLFGPDGLLYIGTGDGGGGGDLHGPRGNAQNLGSLLGKILRIDPRRSGGRPYSVPRDNPFVGRAGARGEIYAYGLRNPWRFSFDRRTRDLTIGDVGQNAWEEIDFVPRGRGAGRGANFGWRLFEGRARYTPGESAPGHVDPVIVRSHDDGNCSITGGVVVRDPAVAGLDGRYVFGDFCRGRIESARLGPRGAFAVRETQPARCRSVVVRRGRARAGLRGLARGPGLPVRGEVIEVALVRAANPSPMTLSGTNTWVVGRDPRGWSIPVRRCRRTSPRWPPRSRRAAVRAGSCSPTTTPTTRRACRPSRDRLGGPPVAAMRHPADVALGDGDVFGPFTALHLPGHAPDHLVLIAGDAGFTGDAVLGAGSVFIAPDGGGLAAYLDGLRRLRALGLARLHPGHGPVIEDVEARLDAYVAHRLEREERLLAALAAGARDEDALLDAAWADAPAALRPVAALTLRAHLEKLRDEDRLPEGRRDRG